MALWNESVRVPPELMLPAMRRFIDFMPTSALQLAWGW